MAESSRYVADSSPESGRRAADAASHRPESRGGFASPGSDSEYSFHGCSVSLRGDYYGKIFCRGDEAAVSRADMAHPGQAVLMLVRQQPLELRDRRGAIAHLPGGSLYLLNCCDPEYVHWDCGSEIHLGLPRSELQHTFRGGLQRLGTCALLDGSGMAPFLRSQMELLDCQAASLGRADLASMFHICINMALLLLGSVLQSSGRDGRPTLFSMALRSIETHGHRPNFNVGALACALGWSRAKLYRVFAEQDTTVNAVLREMRLERARQLIEDPSYQIPVGTLAYACGFTDHSSFGKMFRERYGVSPRQWRERLRSGGGQAIAAAQSLPPAWPRA